MLNIEHIKNIDSEFPFPWITEEYPDKGWDIKDSDGKVVMYCASFTGDGATIQMEYKHAQYLVELLNNLINMG